MMSIIKKQEKKGHDGLLLLIEGSFDQIVHIIKSSFSKMKEWKELKSLNPTEHSVECDDKLREALNNVSIDEVHIHGANLISCLTYSKPNLIFGTTLCDCFIFSKDSQTLLLVHQHFEDNTAISLLNPKKVTKTILKELKKQ